MAASSGGGASSMNGTTCHKPWYAGDAKQSTCRVEHANVEINGGKITALLFGGGEGISYTGSASLTITDGDMSAAWVTAGGSNGYTGSAGVTVQGGKIHVLQSVNRGTMDEATMKVSAGTIDSMYVGGESGDTSVTGSIAAVTAAVLGGTVNELNPGTSGGTLIAPDEGKMNVTYLPDSVGNQDDLGTAFGDQIKAIYTVRFETGGGSAVDSVSVTEGETLTLPAAPSREGYTFTGWYRDETLADLWDQGDPVTAHMSLYAGWEKNTYLVTFAGSLLPTASVAYGDKIVKPNDPLKQGYTFAGWYADADFAAAWDFNTPVTANTVLYAKWRKAAPPAPEQPEHNQPGDNPQTGDAGQAGVPLLILSGALAGFAILIRQ